MGFFVSSLNKRVAVANIFVILIREGNVFYLIDPFNLKIATQSKMERFEICYEMTRLRFIHSYVGDKLCLHVFNQVGPPQ